MLFVLRHGERWDQSDSETENSRVTVASDPPLTEFGHKQAAVSAEYIKSLIGESTLPIKIVSSPYYRTLETTSAICRALDVFQVQASNLMGEAMLADSPVYPFDELLIKSIPPPEGLEMTWDDRRPKCDESYEEMHDRFVAGMQEHMNEN